MNVVFTDEELHRNLCIYDKRYTFYNQSNWGITPGQEHCGCHNCIMGLDRLSRVLLEYNKEIREDAKKKEEASKTSVHQESASGVAFTEYAATNSYEDEDEDIIVVLTRNVL